MYCRQCGNKLLDSDKFCSKCGAKVIPTDNSQDKVDSYYTMRSNFNSKNNAQDS